MLFQETGNCIKRILYPLLFLLLLSFIPSISAWRTFYYSTGGVEVWYLGGATTPTYIPVAYTHQPVYIENISSALYNTTFTVLLKPLNQTSGITPHINYSTVYTFSPGSSQYVIPASVFAQSGEYRIHEPTKNETFFLFSPGNVPAQLLSQSNYVTYIMGAAIIVLFVAVLFLFFRLKKLVI